MIFWQLDGTIIAPTDPKAWSKGLFQWLEFSKLVGITIQGKGTIDGKGSIWWQDQPYDDPLDNEEKLIIPLNHTKVSPPMPVNYLSFLILTSQYLYTTNESNSSYICSPIVTDSKWHGLENAKHETNCEDNLILFKN